MLQSGASLSGEYNGNFASEKSELLISFLNNKLNLKINNKSTVVTSRTETTRNTVFSQI